MACLGIEIPEIKDIAGLIQMMSYIISSCVKDAMHLTVFMESPGRNDLAAGE